MKHWVIVLGDGETYQLTLDECIIAEVDDDTANALQNDAKFHKILSGMYGTHVPRSGILRFIRLDDRHAEEFFKTS